MAMAKLRDKHETIIIHSGIQHHPLKRILLAVGGSIYELELTEAKGLLLELSSLITKLQNQN